ncbi:Ppx/GppA phosphatase family protein [Micrococcus lylae]|nr:Ppx/GppA phosphatase family protein [Micrococcus lylae]WIK83428.1 Ppx/GppA phosphatase family protein [Micrococcus lylae]
MAGIDCGTNSIRLLIARPDEQDPETLVDVVREMTIVRLGEGVDATGEFSAAALERTFAAVDAYARLVQRHHAGAVRFVATSATRDVQNRQVFVDGVTQRLGVEPEVISGAEEASLSFRGAVSALPPGLDPQDRVLVVDLGGGSTEFVVGTAAGEVLDAVSTDMGCVRFTERFLPDADPTEDQVAAATAGVDEILDHVAGRLPLETVSAVVGVAGTVTTVTAHALGLEDYDSERIHATVLPVDEVTASARALRAASREERTAMGFMHPGRVDVIGAGALIWSRIVERMREVAGVTDVVTSERDILDGIVLSMKDH